MEKVRRRIVVQSLNRDRCHSRVTDRCLPVRRIPSLTALSCPVPICFTHVTPYWVPDSKVTPVSSAPNTPSLYCTDKGLRRPGNPVDVGSRTPDRFHVSDPTGSGVRGNKRTTLLATSSPHSRPLLQPRLYFGFPPRVSRPSYRLPPPGVPTCPRRPLRNGYTPTIQRPWRPQNLRLTRPDTDPFLCFDLLGGYVARVTLEPRPSTHRPRHHRPSGPPYTTGPVSSGPD